MNAAQNKAEAERLLELCRNHADAWDRPETAAVYAAMAQAHATLATITDPTERTTP